MSCKLSDALVPAYAQCVLDVLEDAGYEAWIVGGWVRDALLGNPAHDVDICTQARWPQTKAALEARGIETHETGIAHGTITAVVEGHPIEITTYRVEGTYSDMRHPDSVAFVDDVREDLARRDLTINAMAYHPRRGLLDPWGGEADLAAGIIRSVGDPRRRFEEDALRVMRAVRFAARFDYTVEPATQAALEVCAPELAHIAQERIGAELDGILATGRLSDVMCTQKTVLCAAVPELAPMVGFEQRSPYHCYDVWEHTRHVVAATEAFSGGLASQRLRWAALLHDVGKPRSFTVDERGQGHFFGHPSVGSHMADRILRRMALPLAMERPCAALVRFHDRPVKATRHSVLRMLSDLDSRCKGQAVPLAFETLTLKRADALSKAAAYRDYAIEIDKIERQVRAVVAEGAPYRVQDLAITGADLIAHVGGRPGPWVGAMLESCLREVVHGRQPNERVALLGWVMGQTKA